MTSPPEKLDDTGQRYEIRFHPGYSLRESKVFGWTDDLDKARCLARDAALKSPEYPPWIRDRQEEPKITSMTVQVGADFEPVEIFRKTQDIKRLETAKRSP